MKTNASKIKDRICQQQQTNNPKQTNYAGGIVLFRQHICSMLRSCVLLCQLTLFYFASIVPMRRQLLFFCCPQYFIVCSLIFSILLQVFFLLLVIFHSLLADIFYFASIPFLCCRQLCFTLLAYLFLFCQHTSLILLAYFCYEFLFFILFPTIANQVREVS